jgi:hypothetical protein
MKNLEAANCYIKRLKERSNVSAGGGARDHQDALWPMPLKREEKKTVM